jgi:Zn-dependent peptidase ImmA (M78 family)
MGKVNTTAIGDSFESVSLSIIKKVIEHGQLGHMIDCLKFIPKAKYYSEKRKKNVTFDLAIEVRPPGAKRYVMVYLIECKKHGRRVSVDKVNTFLFDLQEVGFANAKGIFITNSPLQEAAYNTAESAGLMLIQGESADNFKILLHRSNRDIAIHKIPFVASTVDEEQMDQGFLLLEKLIDEDLLTAFQPILFPNHVGYGIDKLSKKDIENIVQYQLDKINPNILTDAVNIGPTTLKRYLKNAYGIEVYELEKSDPLLGICDLEANRIGINKSIVNTNREFFVLCHEFGHYVLHQKLAIGQQLYNSFTDSEFSYHKGSFTLDNPRQWIEWQANYFASSFIMPRAQFQARLWQIQDLLNKSRGRILLDDTGQHIKAFYNIVNKLAYRYHVSKTTIIYKLYEMDLINNQSRLKSVGQLIDEYTEGNIV